MHMYKEHYNFLPKVLTLTLLIAVYVWLSGGADRRFVAILLLESGLSEVGYE
jgi:hypothetical protein